MKKVAYNKNDFEIKKGCLIAYSGSKTDVVIPVWVL